MLEGGSKRDEWHVGTRNSVILTQSGYTKKKNPCSQVYQLGLGRSVDVPPLSVASPRAPEVTGGWRYNIAGAARRSVVIRVLERVVVLVVPGLLLVVRVAPPGGGN